MGVNFSGIKTKKKKTGEEHEGNKNGMWAVWPQQSLPTHFLFFVNILFLSVY